MKLRHTLWMICFYAITMPAMEEEEGRVSPSSPPSLALNFPAITMNVESSAVSVSEPTHSPEGSEKEFEATYKKESARISAADKDPLILELQILNTAVEHMVSNMTAFRILIEKQNTLLEEQRTSAHKQRIEEQRYYKFRCATKILSINMTQDRKAEGVDADMQRIIDRTKRHIVGSKKTNKEKKARSKKRRASVSGANTKKSEDKVKRDEKK